MDMSPQQAASTPYTSSAPRSVNVLVVDDDDDLRDALADLLRTEGYTVFTAPDGMTALQRLRTHPAPMVVLLDWYMPGMDGVQVVQALAADAPVVQPHIFIVITATDSAGKGQLIRALAAIPAHLAVTVLGKPFDLDDLLAVVARAAAHIGQDA
jgi:CheY-like chemotaxis protein